MNCPYCNGEVLANTSDTKQLNYKKDGTIDRRRRCATCMRYFTTREQVVAVSVTPVTPEDTGRALERLKARVLNHVDEQLQELIAVRKLFTNAKPLDLLELLNQRTSATYPTGHAVTLPTLESVAAHAAAMADHQRPDKLDTKA